MWYFEMAFTRYVGKFGMVSLYCTRSLSMRHQRPSQLNLSTRAPAAEPCRVRVGIRTVHHANRPRSLTSVWILARTFSESLPVVRSRLLGQQNNGSVGSLPGVSMDITRDCGSRRPLPKYCSSSCTPPSH